MRDFSFEFEENKVTAIVGASGSGKTTVMQLIERFYEPQVGTMTVGGIPLSKVDGKELRRSFLGYVG